MEASEQKRLAFVQGILITALEGGIGYWARIDRYKPAQREATILEADENVRHEINAQTIERGIERIRGGGMEIRTDIRRAIVVADAESDAAEIDVEAADCILQAGLFDEIRYS